MFGHSVSFLSFLNQYFFAHEPFPLCLQSALYTLDQRYLNKLYLTFSSFRINIARENNIVCKIYITRENKIAHKINISWEINIACNFPLYISYMRSYFTICSRAKKEERMLFFIARIIYIACAVSIFFISNFDTSLYSAKRDYLYSKSYH